MIAGKENPVDTFYYVKVKLILVGGEVPDIPRETCSLSPEGFAGTIIDLGTTLSYFADLAYEIIKRAFERKMKGYPVVKDFLILDHCYNVLGSGNSSCCLSGSCLGDGAIWNFPVENYFIKLKTDDMSSNLGEPEIGFVDYQQQNFHILYDVKKSTFASAPTNCADV